MVKKKVKIGQGKKRLKLVKEKETKIKKSLNR